MSQQRIYYSEEGQKQAQRQKFILAMAVASVSLSLGAIIALLFAPQTGENIRKEISDYMDELAKQGKHASEDLADNVRNNANKARKIVKEQVS